MILKLNKINFTAIKVLIFLEDADFENILISKKISSNEKSYKYFIGYLYHDYKVKTLHIMLPKKSTYVKHYYGQTKWMYFLIEDDDLLEKYNTIWDKVSANIKKECDSKPAYNKNILKTKIRSYGGEITEFHDKEIPNVNSNHIFLAVISLHSVLKNDENCYLQVFLEECKYIEKEGD